MEEKTGIIRDEQGRYIPGVSGNPEGRPPETQEQKLMKKAVKVLVEEYKESLAEVLPELSPVLKAEALKGNIPAIKEVHDRIMGKAEQHTDITTDGKPMILRLNE